MYFVKLFLLFAGFAQVHLVQIDVLTANFFDNLKGHPYLITQPFPSTLSQQFIDKQSENFVKLVTGESIKAGKKKRDLFEKTSRSDEGFFQLQALRESGLVPVKFPEDVVVFQRNKDVFAAGLESPGVKDKADNLVIFKFHNGTFTEICRTSVSNAVKLAIIQTQNITLVAVAENDSPKLEFYNKSGIYQFDESSTLTKIQSIDMHFANDITLWELHGEIFMSIAQFKSNGSYETQIPIYKWLGNHFDLFQNVTGQGVEKITHFTVKGMSFLAIANSRDSSGNTNIYSDIYKFEYSSEKYELYQRILTKACKDIKVFQLGQQGREKDTFLVVANSETASLIYKFVDDYFIPFQSLQINGIQQFLPVQGPALVLFASSRFEGLKSFQYDGWSFKELPVKTSSALRSGITSIRAITFNNSIIISIKGNNGKNPNMFTLEFSYFKHLNNVYNEMITWCDNSLKKIQDLTNGPLFETILQQPKRADIDENIEDTESKIEHLDFLLNQLNFHHPREITSKQLIFNNITLMHDLKTKQFNSFNEEFMDNVLNIEQGFDINESTFSSIQTQNFKVQTINGEKFENLLHGADLTLDTVTISGKITAPRVNTKQLNGVSLANVLLRHGDQNFNQSLQINDVKVGTIKTPLVNGANLTKQTQVNHVVNLSVKNLTIGGYINDVDVPTLEKHALKTRGDQEVSGDFIFEHLHGKNLEVFGELSGRKLSDLIGTDSGNYTINQDIVFKDIIVEDLTVTDSLNGIKVTNGKLDVLLKNSTQQQFISAEKIFNNVAVHHAIYLQGHINSEHLEKINPVVSINENLFLEGDKTVSEIQIEDLLNVKDIVTHTGTYSLSKLTTEGLHLNSTEIKPHLDFVQQLNVHDIFLDTINSQKPENFIVTGNEETQAIDSVKIFTGDVTITGTSNTFKINSVDVEDLENKVLKTESDQAITGKHHVKDIIVKQLKSDDVKINDNVIIQNGHTLNVTVNDFDGKIINVKNLIVNGFINQYNFTSIVKDTVRKNATLPISGHKHFTSLQINHLKSETTVKTKEQIQGPVKFNNINIKNIYFGEACNGLNATEFGKEPSKTVTGDQVFDTVVIHGKALITSNKINHVSFDDLYNQTVKLDEPFRFDSATFDEIVSKSITLNGDVENLDFDNIVTTSISGVKSFKNLTINGSVTFDSFVNSINITDLCYFTNGEMNSANLTIQGDVVFVKNPNVVKLNSTRVDDIKRRAWFANDNVTLTGSVDFGDVRFQNDVFVGGFVDNVSLDLVYENYFSKSRDQNITACFNFDGVVFENDITVDKIDGADVINNINLDEFVRTALINDFDQVFEAVVFVENCSIKNLSGDFLTNNLNLAQDVLRYDQVNMVTGKKVFDNLDVELLKLDKNIKIQDVDVLFWFKNSVLKSSSCNITGTKIFKSATFQNGFYVSGLMNDQKFDIDNILVKNQAQDISGVKTITTNDELRFKSIKLKGLINDVDIQALISNQAQRQEDNIFKTSLNLYNNITTRNLIMKDLYQNINVTELMSQVTNLGFLNNLLQQYEKLLVMSRKIYESIQGQAYFLHHYKIIQTIPMATNSRKITCRDGVTRIGILTNYDGTIKMDLYGWQDYQFKKNATIRFSDHPYYVDQVLMGKYLYSEGSDNTGHFIQMSTDKTVTILSNTTINTASFYLSEQPCTIFIFSNSPPRIYCEIDETIIMKQILERKAFSVSVLTTSETVYITLITQPQDLESHIDLYRYEPSMQLFLLHQSIYLAQPSSVASANYKGLLFVAIASGYMENAMYSGRVEVRLFDENTSTFVPWQNLELDAPIQVEFAVLASNELVLYVLKDTPIEPLLVYRYEGIGGFKLLVRGTALPRILSFEQVSQFLIAQGREEINVIEAVFKGEKVAG